MFSLQDKVAVVTGGAQGIGKGIASALVQAGAEVVIGDVDVRRGEETAALLGAEFRALDVTDHDGAARWMAQLAADKGRVDIVCSNVGVFPQAMLEAMDEADWDGIFRINVKGMFNVVQPALALMRKQGKGRVIITSSITGPVTGFPGWSHYGATKAAQLGFMRSAALEYARYGVTVNAVMPGNILTEGLQAQGEAYLAQTRAAIPMHTLGKPEDIGYAACFFASDEAQFITGQQIIIDGGQILPELPEALL